MEFSGITAQANPLPPGARGLVAKYSFVFPKVVGDTTATQVLAAIRNLTASPLARIARVTRLSITMEQTTAVTSPSANLRAIRAVASALGGGTDVPKSLADTLYTGASSLITALSAVAGDAGAATAITGGAASPGTPSANSYGSALGNTLHTAVGQRFNASFDLLRVPLILRAGEAVTVQVGVPSGANPATAQYAVVADVEEFTT